MGIFDALTGAGTKRGVKQGAALLAMGEGEAVRRLNEGREQALREIDLREPLALESLSRGFDRGRETYQGAKSYFEPYAQTGERALVSYADLSGANGPEGFERAKSAFRTSPGYEKQRDEAIDAVARKASATGALASGNTFDAITTKASDLADQEYDKYAARFMPLAQLGFGARTAQAGLEKGVGDLHVAQGGAEAGIIDANATRRAGIQQQTMQAGANAALGMAGGQANLAVQGGKASDQASGNILNLGLNLAKLGVGAASGGLFSGLAAGIGGIGMGSASRDEHWI